MICTKEASPDVVAQSRAVLARLDAQVEFDVNRVERRIEEMNQMFAQMGAKLAQALQNKGVQKELAQAISVVDKSTFSTPAAKTGPKKTASPKSKATVPVKRG